MNQYCIYCSHCINDGGLYCCTDDRPLTENAAKRANKCRHYEQSPLGHVITGKQYRPQRWRYIRVYSKNDTICPE